MKACRMPDGRVLLPRRAETPGGGHIDGCCIVPADDPLAQEWFDWYGEKGEEMPPVPDTPFFRGLAQRAADRRAQADQK